MTPHVEITDSHTYDRSIQSSLAVPIHGPTTACNVLEGSELLLHIPCMQYAPPLCSTCTLGADVEPVWPRPTSGPRPLRSAASTLHSNKKRSHNFQALRVHDRMCQAWDPLLDGFYLTCDPKPAIAYFSTVCHTATQDLTTKPLAHGQLISRAHCA